MSDRVTQDDLPESAWYKSSHSSGEGGECVEVAAEAAAVHVRDAKRAGGPVLTVGREAWAGFVASTAGRQV